MIENMHPEMYIFRMSFLDKVTQQSLNKTPFVFNFSSQYHLPYE